MDEVNDVDDTEAEAVLLALGRQVEWHQPMPEQVSSFWLGSGGMGAEEKTYAIRFEDPPASILRISPTYVSPAPYRVRNYSNEKDRPSRKYRTVDAAKAACERHCATGKWE